jgi:hypothetical protein
MPEEPPIDRFVSIAGMPIQNQPVPIPRIVPCPDVRAIYSSDVPETLALMSHRNVS